MNDQICNHRSCLESFVMKFTRDLEDANDLVQDTLIKAIHKHHLYKQGTNHNSRFAIYIPKYSAQNKSGFLGLFKKDQWKVKN